MNTNRIVSMMIRMFMRTIMQKGMRAGINKFANRKKKSGSGGDSDPPPGGGSKSDYNDPGMNKRTRQSLRVSRRMGKF